MTKGRSIIVIVCIVILVILAFFFGELIGAFPWQYINKNKINEFIEDSSYAFSYELPTIEDKVEWNSILTNNLANKITATTYAARNNYSLDIQDDAYVIPSDIFESERSNLFGTLGNQEFVDNQLLTHIDNKYLLHLKDIKESDLSYKIVDIFLGLKGSEPTSVTVLYTLNRQQSELKYVLTEDKSSPYTFKVDDIEILDEE